MKHKKRKFFIALGVVLAIVLGFGAFMSEQYYRFGVSNFESYDGEEHGYYVYPGATSDSVLELVQQDYDVASLASLRWHSRQLMYRYPEPGYYRFPASMGNKTYIRKLQNGLQTPVRITFNHFVRTREQLAGKVTQYLLMDSLTLLERLDSTEYMQHFGFTRESAVCLFIPNTYEVYWTVTPDQLFVRMQSEYNRWWNEERRHKADSLGLTPVEVATLASIVESESHNKQELPLIASLYLNRVHKGMLLQACPTVIFAVGDFKMKRVLNSHLAIDSPYNTYLYRGLPPGPIRCPSPETMDIVLNAPKTDYLFMCANPDFSGTHIFSSHYGNHAAVAAEWRRSLEEQIRERERLEHEAALLEAQQKEAEL